MEEFDLIIIGAGSAGYVCAIRSGDLGKKVLIIENREVGGTCLNRGCIPTKALLHVAKVYRDNKQSEFLGINIKDMSFDPININRYKDSVVRKLNQGVEYLLKSRRVTIKRGRGYLVDGNVVEVESNGCKERFFGRDIVIATGSEPLEFENFNIDHKNILTSDDALNLKEYPKEITIIGAGAIGIEFGTFFNAFGTKVRIIEMLPNVLPTIKDTKISNQLQRILEKRGINFILGRKIEKITNKDEFVELYLDDGEIIKTEKVLVSIGRKYNSTNLGLEKVGINIVNGKIVVNEKLQTNISNHYAIGDVTGGLLLAHKAMKEGEVCAEIISGIDSKIDYKTIPWVVYSDPEVATVGLTEEELLKQNVEYVKGEFPFSANGKAVTQNETDGFVKIVAKKDNNVILGAQIVGPDASVLISELTLALKNGLKLEDIADTIHPHPTTSEAILEASKIPLGSVIHIYMRK